MEIYVFFKSFPLNFIDDFIDCHLSIQMLYVIVVHEDK